MLIILEPLKEIERILGQWESFSLKRKVRTIWFVFSNKNSNRIKFQFRMMNRTQRITLISGDQHIMTAFELFSQEKESRNA